jgi:hypothetical protein
MGDGILNLSQIMVYDSTFTSLNKKNLALGKAVFATSNQSVASILTDGSTTVRMAPNVWQSATPDPASEYVEIDLGSEQFVYGIRLLGRTDCDPGNPDCPNRMRNVRIEMSLTPSADGASFLETQTAAIISSGATASAANFQGASTAVIQGASGTAFLGVSAAQGLRDSAASLEGASAANFQGASTANFEAKQQASGTAFLGASASQGRGAGSASGNQYRGAGALGRGGRPSARSGLAGAPTL